MIHIIDYAHLSLHVYSPHLTVVGPMSIEHHTYKEALGEGFNRMTDVTPYVSPANDFYAALYIKTIQNEPTDAVVAIRGTVFNKISNVTTDVESWYSSALGTGSGDTHPKYLDQALSFIVESYYYINTYFPALSGHPIRLTGHSLGGALAKLATLTALPYPSVVFNAPGVGDMPGLDKERSCMIHNIDSKYGVLNKIGTTLGKTNYIESPDENADAKKMFVSFDRLKYAESTKDYNKHSDLGNLEGLSERLASFLSTSDALDQTQAYKNTDTGILEPVFFLNEIDPFASNSIGKTEAYYSIIKAQHSIANLIKALQSDRYRSLAMALV